MITYKEFIDKMIEKGYKHISEKPITIDKSNDMIKTFHIKKGKIGKVLELQCPDNSIIAMCGTEHNGGCHNAYICNIACTDDKDKQPFQEIHNTTELKSNKHIVAEIIVTKILQKEAPKDNKKIKEWSETAGPILKLIESNNNREHIMWIGAYPKFDSEFIKTSFTLYGGQKMMFYINNPDTDIDKVEFNISLDIFEKLT